MSAIWTLQEAMDAAFQGDATLAPLLYGEKVYSLLGPTGDIGKLGYILLSNSAETRWDMFDAAPAFSGAETISVWHGDRSKKGAAIIAGHIVRILSLPLSLDGYNFVTGEPAVISLGIDPDLKFTRATIRYEVLSHA